MGMSVLLLTGRHGALDVDGTAGLADLGVSYVAIFKHARTLAVVLDGASFDPRASARTAVDLIAGQDGECIQLELVAELTLANGYGSKAGLVGGGS